MGGGSAREPNWSVATRHFPSGGAFRLHRSPTELRPRDIASGPDRFDDPDGEFRVRYFASTLLGCCLEVLDHFRPNAEAVAALDGVTNVIGVDILDDEPPGLVPEQWLAQQQIVRAHMDGSDQLSVFIDVNSDELLAVLDGWPSIREVMNGPEVVSALGPDARLDQGTIRLVGRVGRQITQAVGRLVHNAPVEPTGIQYLTRFDQEEECWAVFDDRVQMYFDSQEELSPLNEEHLEAVRIVAERYGVVLPGSWMTLT